MELLILVCTILIIISLYATRAPVPVTAYTPWRQPKVARVPYWERWSRGEIYFWLIAGPLFVLAMTYFGVK